MDDNNNNTKPADNTVEFTLGLPKKNEENDIDCYKEMKMQQGRHL